MKRRRDRSDEGGDDRGDHDVRRIRRALRRAVTDDARGQQGEARRVQAQEHDLAVAGLVLRGVALLHALHRLQAEGRGCAVQPQEVRSEVQGHEAVGLMVLRQVGEDPAEHGREEVRELFHGARIHQQVQQSAEEGEVADQRQPQVRDRAATGLEQSVGRLFAHVRAEHTALAESCRACRPVARRHRRRRGSRPTGAFPAEPGYRVRIRPTVPLVCRSPRLPACTAGRWPACSAHRRC